MKSGVIEFVLYRPKAGIDERQFQDAALRINPALQSMDGFVSREFVAAPDGRYADIVRWRDAAAVKAAMEKVHDIPDCRYFFSLIDEKMDEMVHFDILNVYP